MRQWTFGEETLSANKSTSQQLLITSVVDRLYFISVKVHNTVVHTITLRQESLVDLNWGLGAQLGAHSCQEHQSSTTVFAQLASFAH